MTYTATKEVSTLLSTINHHIQWLLQMRSINGAWISFRCLELIDSPTTTHYVCKEVTFPIENCVNYLLSIQNILSTGCAEMKGPQAPENCLTSRMCCWTCYLGLIYSEMSALVLHSMLNIFCFNSDFLF